jgi:mono/diheme cytochrome c family protein
MWVQWLSSGSWIRGILLGVLATSSFSMTAVADSPTANTDTLTPQALGSAPVDGLPGEAADLAVQLFQRKCIGCHTIGGGALSGPDLKPVATWPRAPLETAIIRMEKSVGPLSPDEVARIADYLLAPDAAERLKSEQERVAMQQAATLEPASPGTGRALFHGERAFAQGGMACSACHVAGARGGTLAASLTDSGTRLGEASLMSTIESPGFPIMRAIYTHHPVSKQEATHLVAYLEELSQEPARQAAAIPLHAIGLAGALAFLASVGWLYRRGPAGTRARLVAMSRSKTRRGAA